MDHASKPASFTLQTIAPLPFCLMLSNSLVLLPVSIQTHFFSNPLASINKN